jgi:hypothetical protein
VEARFGLDLTTALSGQLTDWVEFSHFGTVKPDTPAAYLLAWLDAPYRHDLAVAIWSRSAQEVIDEWGRAASLASLPEERLAQALGVERALESLGTECCEPLARWLTDAGFEMANVKWDSSEARDVAFDALGAWLRGGWRWSDRQSRQLRALVGVTPVLWRKLYEFEEKARVALPADLRRLLLEVGDVGQALFGSPFLTVANVTDGLESWQWEDLVRFLDVDGKVRGSLGWSCQRLHVS